MQCSKQLHLPVYTALLYTAAHIERLICDDKKETAMEYPACVAAGTAMLPAGGSQDSPGGRSSIPCQI